MLTIPQLIARPVDGTPIIVEDLRDDGPTVLLSDASCRVFPSPFPGSGFGLAAFVVEGIWYNAITPDLVSVLLSRGYSFEQILGYLASLPICSAPSAAFGLPGPPGVTSLLVGGAGVTSDYFAGQLAGLFLPFQIGQDQNFNGALLDIQFSAILTNTGVSDYDVVLSVEAEPAALMVQTTAFGLPAGETRAVFGRACLTVEQPSETFRIALLECQVGGDRFTPALTAADPVPTFPGVLTTTSLLNLLLRAGPDPQPNITGLTSFRSVQVTIPQQFTIIDP